MRLILVRSALRPLYTIGHLYIDGVYFCDTIEGGNTYEFNVLDGIIVVKEV